MDPTAVVLSLENSVRTIRVNRPKTKNAFDTSVYTIIKNTLNQDANNDEVIMTILTGTGTYYSSGFDIKEAVMKYAEGNAGVTSTELRDMINAFINYPKLLVALVNGPAIGIAVTTLALCDIVYASDRATFETPFSKVGLCAEGCSSYTFPRILGRSRASEMLLLGMKVDAEEAFRLGLVSRVVPHKQLAEFTKELKNIGSNVSPNSVKVTKRLMMDHKRELLRECNERELLSIGQCAQSEDFSRGIAKFMASKSKL